MRRLSTLVAVLALAGCQLPPTATVPFGFERGGVLPTEEYARLEPIARAHPSADRIAVGHSIETQPLVIYVYSFKPGFDPVGITRLEVGPFDGKPGKEAEIAAELPGVLARRLTKDGLPATTVSVGTPGAYVLTGTVTHTGNTGSTMYNDIGIQVEAKVTRGDTVVGSMQINAVGMSGAGGVTGAQIIGLLISSALEGSRAEIVSRHIADIFRRARAGEREGAFGGGVAGMRTSAATGAQAR